MVIELLCNVNMKVFHVVTKVKDIGGWLGEETVAVLARLPEYNAAIPLESIVTAKTPRDAETQIREHMIHTISKHGLMDRETRNQLDEALKKVILVEAISTQERSIIPVGSDSMMMSAA